MASSSPNNEHSLTETLNRSVSMASSPQSTDEVAAAAADGNSNGNNTGEKRKREEAQQKPDLSLNPYYKTTLCSYFRRQSGSCSHGSDCKYAHGEEELRPRPDNTWDPTSERAKKAMKLEEEKNDDKCEEKEEEEEIMMTEMVVGDNGEGGEGGCLDPELSKCLVHLPRKWNNDNLRNFLNQQGVVFRFAKKKKGMTVGFMTCESADQLKCASEALEGKSVGNRKIKVADVIPRSYDKKIKSAMDGENAGVSKSSDVTEDGDTNDDSSILDGSSSKAKSARDAVTPLAHMPYDDQLEHKKNSIMQMLKKLVRNNH